MTTHIMDDNTLLDLPVLPPQGGMGCTSGELNERYKTCVQEIAAAHCEEATTAMAPPAAQEEDEALFDPWCDPANPRSISFQDVSAAAYKIKSGIINTPCTKSHLCSITDMDIFLKKEFNQYTGSFKERGARYTLLCLTEEQKKKGVIAASAGNHALALCYHGSDLNIPVTVVMPLMAPIMKVQSCRQYGGNIMVRGNDIGESRKIALRMAKEQDLLYFPC